MTDTHYKITMDGSLAPGVTLEFAQDNFARLFKTDVSAVKRLFSGGQTVIKRGISEAEADKYVQALFSAGVVARKELDLVTSLSLESIESEHDAENDERMTCPKCEAEQARSEMCANCGIVIAKFNHYQAQAQQVATSTPASPYASPLAMAAQDDNEVGELNIWGINGRIGRMRYVAWSMVFTFAMLLLVFMTDFVKISLATDNVRWNPVPDRLEVAPLVKIGASEKLKLALVSISMHCAPMVLGKSWPPKSTGCCRPCQPPATNFL